MEEENKDILPTNANDQRNNIDNNGEIDKVNEPKIVKTDKGSKDGQDKCPRCGATEITTNINTGKLRCLSLHLNVVAVVQKL